MPIKTAANIGFEEVDANYIQNKRLTRKIFALAAFGIQFSEGFLVLLRPDASERPILERIIVHAELKRIGKRLMQDQLEKIVLEIIFSLYLQQLDSFKLHDGDKYEDVIAKLDLDMNLQIQHEREEQEESDSLNTNNQFIIIATEDELNMQKGALMVAQHENRMLSVQSPMNFLASPEGQNKMKQVLETKMMSIVEDLFNLPMLADPEEFENTLRSLSPPMRANKDNEHQLIMAATMNFDERPARSRKVIVEVMKKHGLHPTLMENISLLCNHDRKVPLQIEAINIVVNYLDRLENETEVTLAALTLIKILEEDAKQEVRLHTLKQLSLRTELILERLPQFLEHGRVISILKFVLLDEPTVYKDEIEKMLLHFGYYKPDILIPMLEEDIRIISDPYVLITFYNVLEVLSTNENKRKATYKAKWKIYFDLIKEFESHPLADTLLANFKAQSPNSILTLLPFFHEFGAKQQIFFVKTLDEMFIEYISESDSDSCKAIAKLFYGLRKSQHHKVLIAVLSSKTIFDRHLGEKYLRIFLPQISANLSELIELEDFVTNIIACGHLHLIEMIEASHDEKVLVICYKKVAVVNRKNKSFVARIQEYCSAGLKLVKAATSFIQNADDETDLADHFSGLVTLANSPIADEKTFRTIFAELELATASKELLQAKTLRTYAELANNEFAQGQFIDFCINIFFKVIKQNETPFSENTGKYTDVKTILVDATSGLERLLSTDKLDASQHHRAQTLLRQLTEKRPFVRTSFRKDPETGQGVPAEDVPDPFKDLLEALLVKFKAKNSE